jgi:acylphosphatase
MMQFENTTVRVIFLGSVQGIGFRYTAVQHATELQISGTVRNLSNGSVELIAQGSKACIDKLIAHLHTNFKEYITASDMQHLPASSSYQDFRVIA